MIEDDGKGQEFQIRFQKVDQNTVSYVLPSGLR